MLMSTGAVALAVPYKARLASKVMPQANFTTNFIYILRSGGTDSNTIVITVNKVAAVARTHCVRHASWQRDIQL